MASNWSASAPIRCEGTSPAGRRPQGRRSPRADPPGGRFGMAGDGGVNPALRSAKGRSPVESLGRAGHPPALLRWPPRITQRRAHDLADTRSTPPAQSATRTRHLSPLAQALRPPCPAGRPAIKDRPPANLPGTPRRALRSERISRAAYGAWKPARIPRYSPGSRAAALPEPAAPPSVRTYPGGAAGSRTSRPRRPPRRLPPKEHPPWNTA